MIKEHKIPTIIAFIVLVFGLILGVFMVQKGQVFFLRASPETIPSEIKITNITDSSFAVSWVTGKEVGGFVKFGESTSLDQTAEDDRQADQGLFFTHHITLQNLKPNTRYFFKIISDGRLFDDEGKPYEQLSAQSVNSQNPPDIASGKVLTDLGQNAEGAIVYISMANSVPQSSLVGSDGTWVIPLSKAFSTNLLGLASYDLQSQVEEIFVQGGLLGKAFATLVADNDNPVPDIILGKTMDLRNMATDTPLPTGTASDPGTSKFSFNELNPPTASNETINLEITNPNREGEPINTGSPEFSGTGPAGKAIQIVVESPRYSGVAIIDKDGNWNWKVPANLDPGEHKISILYGGKTITRSFVVLAVGESNLPAFTATPSGETLPTPTPSPTPSVSGTPTGTITSTPTPLPTTTMPATSSGTPTAGYLTTTILALIMGLVLILIGFVVNYKLAHAR